MTSRFGNSESQEAMTLVGLPALGEDDLVSAAIL